MNIQLSLNIGSIAMFLNKIIIIFTTFTAGIFFAGCDQNREEKVAERYRDMVKSSTGKMVSVDEVKEMLKKLESEKSVKSDEIEQTKNLLKAKYDFKIFPPEELQGKKIFTFVIQDYLLKDDRNVFFIGQLDDITNEEGKFTIHLFAQLQLSDWQGRNKAHFHLSCDPESIESIINNPPDEPRAGAGFQKQYFVICRVNDLYRATAYSRFNLENERIGSEILMDVSNEYQIEGDLVEIIPYPK
jgi:hypothetical protein